MKWSYVLLGLIGVVIVVGLVRLVRIDQRERHSKWVSAEMVKRCYPISRAVNRLCDEPRRRDQRIPDSMEAIRLELAQTDFHLLLDEDDRTNRVFARAVLLHNVTTPEREEAMGNATTRMGYDYKWLIVSVLPKFDPLLQEDLICYGGEFAEGGPATVASAYCIPATQARELLGTDVVDAAYRAYQKDLEN